MKDLLTPSEVSQETGLAVSTLKTYRALGRGPKFIRVGRSIRYPFADLQDWMANKVDGRKRPKKI